MPVPTRFLSIGIEASSAPRDTARKNTEQISSLRPLEGIGEGSVRSARHDHLHTGVRYAGPLWCGRAHGVITLPVGKV
jgi:hypothetical protein